MTEDTDSLQHMYIITRASSNDASRKFDIDCVKKRHKSKVTRQQFNIYLFIYLCIHFYQKQASPLQAAKKTLWTLSVTLPFLISSFHTVSQTRQLLYWPLAYPMFKVRLVFNATAALFNIGICWPIFIKWRYLMQNPTLSAGPTSFELDVQSPTR